MSADYQAKEACAKKPPTTVKRRAVSAEMSRGELLQLVSVMEGELQARDISLAVLKAERTQHYVRQAKYGCVITTEGPFDALQRDAELSGNYSSDVESLNVVNAKQVLDGFVDTQRKTQLRTRIQLAAIEKQFHKVCAQLETANEQREAVLKETSDIRNALEIEKQCLQLQYQEQKDENDRLVVEIEELKKLLAIEKAESVHHCQAASALARDRIWLAGKMTNLDQLVIDLESSLNEEKNKNRALATELSQRISEHQVLEGKWLVETERNRSAMEEKESKLLTLSSEVEQIRQQLLRLHHSEIDGERHWQTEESSIESRVVRLPDAVSTSSCDVVLPFNALPNADGVDVSKVPFFASAGSIANGSTLLSDNIPGRLPGLSSNHSPVSAGFQHSPVAAVNKQGLLSATNVGDFTPAVRQSKSADMTDALTLMVESHNSAVIGGSCPNELSSSGLLSVVKKSESGISSTGVRQHGLPFASTSFQAPPSSANSMALEIFGPEMADLQELLVSMASDRVPTSNVSLTPSFTAAADISPQMPNLSLSPASAMHAAILTGNGVHLFHLLSSNRVDLNEPIDGGILLLHCAVEFGSEDCVRVLLESGADTDVARDDGRTPLHVAAADGHIKCLQLLLEFHGSPLMSDQQGWTPLHCAAVAGHGECCRMLIDYGARIDAITNESWTPLHVCVQSGHSACLVTLMTHRQSPPSSWSSLSTQDFDQQVDTLMLENIACIVDKDGWTLGHLATVRDTKDCLDVLMRYIHIDVERRDKWNRSVLDVASPVCRQVLLGLDGRQDIMCTVTVDLPTSSPPEIYSSPKKASGTDGVLSVTLGTVVVSKGSGWSELEEKLNTVFLNHISEVSVGLRTKKTCRFDQDCPDPPSPFTLGLSLNSVKYFSIGRYHWSPGTSTEKLPYDMLCGFNCSSVSVKLFGLDNGSYDSLAYETVVPVSILQNYLRLIEQYKSVVFYGPKGMGKTYLVKKLAQCIQTREMQAGNTSEITVFTLSTAFSRKDLLKLLLDKGCLVTSLALPQNNSAPVLVLDDLSKISVVEVFKDILPAMETRGPANSIIIRRDGSQEGISCYLHPNCYIIGTMDRSRSTGLELSIQQRFKWVQLRCDQEPMRCLLHRHMLRRLAHAYSGIVPMPDNSVYKAVEWIICVWQRLNEGLSKLGLLDMVFGPCFFLSCPVEANKPKPILKWLCYLWNTSISPAIAEAVIKGSGADTGISSGGQTKVASTALYVLMQRAIVPGCPLSGQEKDRYFASFNGTNELDIKVRGEKREVKPAAQTAPVMPALQSTGTMKLNKSASAANSAKVHESIAVGRDGVVGSTMTVNTMLPNGSRTTVGNSMSGVPPLMMPKAGVPMHLTNGSLVPGTSVITSAAFTNRESVPEMKVSPGATSSYSIGLHKKSTSSVVSPSRVMGGSDSLFGMVARPSSRSAFENVANNTPVARHSPVVMTQPGRSASPVTNIQMVDRSRSMTPPSSGGIDRSSGERLDLSAIPRSLAVVRSGFEVASSTGHPIMNPLELSDPRVSVELSLRNRARNDLAYNNRNDLAYNNTGPYSRPSSAGTGMGHYAGIENGGRLGSPKASSLARGPHLTDALPSNSTVK